jgi:hypothetical protein
MRPLIWIFAFLILTGWAGQLVTPLFFAMQDDETSIVDGKACRNVKTVFDTNDTPSCFSKVADDLATTGGASLPRPRFRDEDSNEEPPLD